MGDQPPKAPPSPNRETQGNGPEYAGKDVRQGEIVLRSRARRIIFIAGLAGIFGLALIARCAGYV